MKKKLVALLFTLALCLGLATTAFAAGSKTDAPQAIQGQKVENVTVNTSTNKTATVTKTDNKKTVTLPTKVKVKGVTYPVTAVAKNAVGTKTVSLTAGSKVKEIKAGAFSKAKKIKTIKLKMVSGAKASSYKIAKGAFKGISTKNATVIIGKHMSLKEYNKLVKKFKAAGFKGKFKRQWIK